MFYNTHTDERLHVVYRRGEGYDPAALASINHELRDHYSGAEYEIDPRLMDFLYDLIRELGYRGEVYIISGYRAPASNVMLRHRGRGVAKESMHTHGRAVDFRLPGVNTYLIWKTARAMYRGGTGYYRQSDFVHIDTGRVRWW